MTIQKHQFNVYGLQTSKAGLVRKVHIGLFDSFTSAALAIAQVHAPVRMTYILIDAQGKVFDSAGRALST